MISSGTGSPACQQATRPAARRRSTSGGSSVRQRAEASGQRAAYAHPGGTCGRVDRAARDGRERLVEVGVHVRARPRPAPGCRGAGRRRSPSARVGRAGPRRSGRRTSRATRSQTSPTTVTSWLISTQRDVVGRADRGEQVEDLLLHGDVERGGRLVGDDQRGRAHQAHADHGPLAHAAGELVRVLPCARARGRGSRTASSRSTARASAPLAVQPLVVARDLGELAADPPGRVEGRHRVLEDHRQRGAEQLRGCARAPSAVEQVGAAEARAGRRPRGRGPRRVARSRAR